MRGKRREKEPLEWAAWEAIARYSVPTLHSRGRPGHACKGATATREGGKERRLAVVAVTLPRCRGSPQVAPKGSQIMNQERETRLPCHVHVHVHVHRCLTRTPTGPTSEGPWVPYHHTADSLSVLSDPTLCPKLKLSKLLCLWLIGINVLSLCPFDGRPPFDDEFRCWNSELPSFLFSARTGSWELRQAQGVAITPSVPQCLHKETPLPLVDRGRGFALCHSTDYVPGTRGLPIGHLRSFRARPTFSLLLVRYGVGDGA